MGYLPMSGNEHFHRGYSLRPHKSKSLINHGIISIPKGTCHEWTVSRMMSHGRLLDEVSRCCYGIRSHLMRHLPDPFGDRLRVRWLLVIHTFKRKGRMIMNSTLLHERTKSQPILLTLF